MDNNNFNLNQEFLANLAKYEKEKLLDENETGNYEDSIDDENESLFSFEDNEEEMEKIIIKNNIITISSIDREWYNNNETPYNFDVKLGGGLQNDFSFIDYEPKNIISIGIDKLLVNSRNINFDYTIKNRNVTSTPFLNVMVNNIDGITYTTNQSTSKSLGIMTPYSTVPKQDNLDSHIEYTNLLNHQKEYYNNPLASLSKLEIKIKNHMNNTPNEINDVLNIKNITYNPAVSSNVATEYLVVETNEYFSNSQYKTGDIIKFNSYQNINTNVYSSAKTFNTFINRDVGHNIIDTSKTDSNKLLSNRIHIPIPYELSTSTGNVSELDWYSEFKSSSLSDVTLSGSITDTSGKLINTNLQNILVFRIKTIEKESNFMNKDSLIK